VITDAVLRDPGIPSETKLVLGYVVGCDRRRPNRDQILDGLPMLRYEQIGAAWRSIAHERLGFVDWSGCKHGHPPRLKRLSERADPHRTHARHLPVAAARRIRGKGAADRALLACLYHGEQHLRGGAFQVADDTAAALLGWTKKKVERARRGLIRDGVIVETQPARGRAGAAVYVLPDALPRPERAEPFNSSRTRTLRRCTTGVIEPVRLYASAAELVTVREAILSASDRRRAAVVSIITGAKDSRIVTAQELLDGPLRLDEINAERRIRDASLNGVWDGSLNGVWDGSLNGDCTPSVPSRPSLTPLRGEGVTTSATTGERPTTETRASARLPLAAAEIANAFGRPLPEVLAREFDAALVRLTATQGGCLGEPQLELVDRALVGAIRWARAQDGFRGDDRYRMLRATIRRVPTSDDLHQRLKELRHTDILTPCGDVPLVDVRADLRELLEVA
jgi:hypothetical protein